MSRKGIATFERPDWDEYYMRIAMAVRARAQLHGQPHWGDLGAKRPDHFDRLQRHPAQHGQLPRRRLRPLRPPRPIPFGQGLRFVHLRPRRAKRAVVGGSLWHRHRRRGDVLDDAALFGCAKEILQAKIHAVYYLHDWIYPDAQRQAGYEELLSFVPGGVRAVAMDDPDAAWAVSSLRQDE